MKKALMIPIRPKHAVNILNGKKTLELRTWIPKDYVGWVYLYVTKKNSRALLRNDLLYVENNELCFKKNYDYGYLSVANKVNKFDENPNLIGKVVARFWFDEYIELEHYDFWDESYYWKNTVISAFELEKATCMSSFEMEEYAKCKPLYAWHIKDLEIFDKPKSLSEFALVSNYKHIVEKMTPYEKRMLIFGNTLKKAPQSYQFVYVKEKLK